MSWISKRMAAGVLQKELNDLGAEKPEYAVNNKAAYIAWKNKVWIKLAEHLMNYDVSNPMPDEAVYLQEALEAFCKGMKSYSPEQGPFANYATKAIGTNFEQIKNNYRAIKASGGVLSSSQAKKNLRMPAILSAALRIFPRKRRNKKGKSSEARSI